MPGRYTRHDEHRPIAVHDAVIKAPDYNCARRALAREDGEGPLWLDLPGLRSLKLAVMPQTWVLADRALNHLPLAAWTGINPGRERALHEDVPCELRIFSSQADRLLPSLIPVIRRQFRSHLGDGGCENCEVVAFCRPGRKRSEGQ